MENISEMELNWIVAYTRVRYEFGRGDGIYEDFWEVCDSLEDAQRIYKGLSEESDVWSASLCVVADSSDYDTHPLLKEVTA